MSNGDNKFKDLRNHGNDETEEYALVSAMQLMLVFLYTYVNTNG